MGNVLNTLSSATKEDAKLYNCIKELYDQGVPFEELKALIPDMKRTENNSASNVCWKTIMKCWCL
mgnify:CR=1 FL=1